MKLSKEDKILLQEYYDEIISIGLEQIKKRKKFTQTEQILWDIFNEFSGRYITKQQICDLYNFRYYGEDTTKYLKPENLNCKINRLNHKLTEYRIMNRYNFGYRLIYLGGKK